MQTEQAHTATTQAADTVAQAVEEEGNISPLFKNATTDTSALKFDALVLKSQLALVDETVNSASSERKITDIAAYLKEKKASIPQVKAKMNVLNEVLSAHFWESKNQLKNILTHLPLL